jgi:hypothetical protein
MPHFSWDLNGPEKIKKRKVKATKGYPQTNAHYKKSDLSQQAATSSSKPTQGADSFRKPGAA